MHSVAPAVFAGLIAAIAAPSGVLVGAHVGVPMARPALAAERRPTREDARALAEKAAELIASKGLETAAALFNAHGEFRYGEIYVSVIDFSGVWRVYPPQPDGVGQNVINVQDPDGRNVVHDVLAIAKGKGEGWVEYRWENPATGRIEPKTTFVKRVPGQNLVAYVGVYRQPGT